MPATIYRVTVQWGDCDPAGIVYFPRFFDFLHRAMEDWFTYGLEERFADFIMVKKLGIPTVSTHTDFVGPARFDRAGDRLVGRGPAVLQVAPHRLHVHAHDP